MKIRVTQLFIAWLIFVALGCMGLPGDAIAPSTMFRVAVAIAAGPTMGVLRYWGDLSHAPPLLWTSLALECATLIVYLWRRSTWSYLSLVITWLLWGLLFAVGLDI